MEMLVGNTVLVVLVGLHVHHALYQVDNGYTEEIIGDSAKKESENISATGSERHLKNKYDGFAWKKKNALVIKSA